MQGDELDISLVRFLTQVSMHGMRIKPSPAFQGQGSKKSVNMSPVRRFALEEYSIRLTKTRNIAIGEQRTRNIIVSDEFK